MARKKPTKKSEKELFVLISESIESGNYIFVKHAKKRLSERDISDFEILNILEGKIGRNRKRNKSKDKYEEHNLDWNYCIEGMDIDNNKIRIIISFYENLMPIITVIKLEAWTK